MTIKNCNNIREISLEHTRIKNIDFSDFPYLEYVYLSSSQDYLVGGSSVDKPGEYLVTAFGTLTDRTYKIPGVVIVRGVSTATDVYPRNYVTVRISVSQLNKINNQIDAKNWTVVWDSGITPLFEVIPYPEGEK